MTTSITVITVHLQSRKDNTRHAIRAEKDTQAMLRIERQFIVMTVMILLVVGIMLSVNTIKDYQLDRLVRLAEKYFNCLKVNTFFTPML